MKILIDQSTLTEHEAILELEKACCILNWNYPKETVLEIQNGMVSQRLSLEEFIRNSKRQIGLFYIQNRFKKRNINYLL